MAKIALPEALPTKQKLEGWLSVVLAVFLVACIGFASFLIPWTTFVRPTIVNAGLVASLLAFIVACLKESGLLRGAGIREESTERDEPDTGRG